MLLSLLRVDERLPTTRGVEGELNVGVSDKAMNLSLVHVMEPVWSRLTVSLLPGFETGVGGPCRFRMVSEVSVRARL